TQRPTRPERALRLQFDVPVQVVQPALVQIVWREATPRLLQLPGVGAVGVAADRHHGLARRAPALGQVAGSAGGDDVLPRRAAAVRTRDDVIEGQFRRFSAILAGEAVAQEDVEAGEGGAAVLVDIVPQRDHAGQLHLHRRRAHHLVVKGYDIDAVLID